MNDMFNLPDLSPVLEKYEYFQKKLSDVEAMRDQEQYVKILKESKSLEPLVAAWKNWLDCTAKLKTSAELISVSDGELLELAQEEEKTEIQRRDFLFHEIRRLLVPKDPEDEKSAVLEIRAGTGGDEAALFAADLCRMYTRYSERKGWKTEIVSLAESDLRGIKEAVFIIEGEGAFGELKFERGVHRVQRVPSTEASGRIHTSAVTVAVLPERTESEVQIFDSDLRIDTFRASGAGGQHVNKTESAVRITHIPTGTVVVCQDEKSQLKNKSRAMKILRSRISESEKEKAHKETAKERKEQVGSGDRSEKIRTYNFPQSRVTDHRIGKTVHTLDLFLDGEIGQMLDALRSDENERRLAEIT